MGKLIIFKKRFVRMLKELQNSWINGKKTEHAQATGMVLSQMASDPKNTADRYLPVLIDFINRNGPYGIDGLFLSAMSAAQILNKEVFEKGSTLIELIDETIDKKSKITMGIYFLDIGYGVRESFRKYGISYFTDFKIDNVGIGSKLDLSSLRNGNYTALINTFLSGFPDSARNSFFKNGSLLDFFDNGMDFGASVRVIGNESLNKFPANIKASLYSDTTNNCMVGFLALGGGVWGAEDAWFWPGVSSFPPQNHMKGMKGKESGIRLIIGGMRYQHDPSFTKGEDDKPIEDVEEKTDDDKDNKNKDDTTKNYGSSETDDKSIEDVEDETDADKDNKNEDDTTKNYGSCGICDSTGTQSAYPVPDSDVDPCDSAGCLAFQAAVNVLLSRGIDVTGVLGPEAVMGIRQEHMGNATFMIVPVTPLEIANKGDIDYGEDHDDYVVSEEVLRKLIIEELKNKGFGGDPTPDDEP